MSKKRSVMVVFTAKDGNKYRVSVSVSNFNVKASSQSSSGNNITDSNKMKGSNSQKGVNNTNNLTDSKNNISVDKAKTIEKFANSNDLIGRINQMI